MQAAVRSRLGIVSPLIVIVAVVVSALLAVSIGPWVLPVPLGVIIWTIAKWAAHEDSVGADLGSTPADPQKHAELITTVRDLAERAGVDEPRVYVLDDDMYNAYAIRSLSGGIVGITSPTLDLLQAEELEAVLAHEIGHLKNRDTFWTVTSIAVGRLLLIPAVVAGWVVAGLIYFGSEDKTRAQRAARRASADGAVEAFTRFGLMLAHLLMSGASRRRELLADQTAADLVDPDALARALEKMDGAPQKSLAMTPANAAVAASMMLNPFRESLRDRAFSSHPPVKKRMRKLEARLSVTEAESFRARRDQAAQDLAYKRDLAAWQERFDDVDQIRSLVANTCPRPATAREAADFRLRRGEEVFASTPAALVELRSRNGQGTFRVTQRGAAVVTTRGVVFSGAKRVRWNYAVISETRWSGRDMVVMQTTTRRNPSGLAFAHPRAQARTLVDIAEADAFGRRGLLLADAQQRVNDLLAERPVPPTAMGQ